MSKDSSTSGLEPAIASGPVFDATGVRMTLDESKIEPYNFRNPGFLSQGQLRQFGVLHEKLVQHLSARLSTFLRMECLLKVSGFQSTTFAKFCEGLGHPTHLALYQVDTLRGVAVLELSLKLGLAMADRLLGGKGVASGAERVLSEIESTLVEDAMHLVMGEWAQLWEMPDRKLKPQCIGMETSGRFLQTSPPEMHFMMLQIEVAFGEINQQMQLGIPFSMIEPFVKRLQRPRAQTDEAAPRSLRWRTPYAGITVPVYAEWNLRTVTLNEVLKMQSGDVIALPRELISDTRLRFSETEEFSGTLGTQNGHLAIHLRERLSRHS